MNKNNVLLIFWAWIDTFQLFMKSKKIKWQSQKRNIRMKNNAAQHSEFISPVDIIVINQIVYSRIHIFQLTPHTMRIGKRTPRAPPHFLSRSIPPSFPLFNHEMKFCSNAERCSTAQVFVMCDIQLSSHERCEYE